MAVVRLNGIEVAKGRGPGIYIGRPSPLGNPFKINREASRETVITFYEAWLREKAYRPGHRDPKVRKALARIFWKARHERVVLRCWCAPLACHGDVIVRMWAARRPKPGVYIGKPAPVIRWSDA